MASHCGGHVAMPALQGPRPLAMVGRRRQTQHDGFRAAWLDPCLAAPRGDNPVGAETVCFVGQVPNKSCSNVCELVTSSTWDSDTLQLTCTRSGRATTSVRTPRERRPSSVVGTLYPKSAAPSATSVAGRESWVATDKSVVHRL